MLPIKNLLQSPPSLFIFTHLFSVIAFTQHWLVPFVLTTLVLVYNTKKYVPIAWFVTLAVMALLAGSFESFAVYFLALIAISFLCRDSSDMSILMAVTTLSIFGIQCTNAYHDYSPFFNAIREVSSVVKSSNSQQLSTELIAQFASCELKGLFQIVMLAVKLTIESIYLPPWFPSFGNEPDFIEQCVPVIRDIEEYFPNQLSPQNSRWIQSLLAKENLDSFS